MELERTEQLPDTYAGLRLDQALSQHWEDLSRRQIQQWIKQGDISVDGQKVRPRTTVLGGESVVLRTEIKDQIADQPQPVALDIVYQDDDIYIINKPADLVVHPGAGNPDQTMVNGLLYLDASAAELPRAGIVHRLDKQTSGLMVVARTLAAYNQLIQALAAREVKREYDAIVRGRMIAGGTVEAPIGRSSRDRQRQAVTPNGKPAVSHYRVVQRFAEHTWVRVQLETGRTHQIRVHMAHIRHPIVGDPLYGGRPQIPKGASDYLIDLLRGFPRQALHARKLSLIHPVSGQELTFTQPMPDDMQELAETLEEEHSGVIDDEPEVIYVRDE